MTCELYRAESYRELAIGVHDVSHADPVGVQKIAGGENDFGAEDVEVDRGRCTIESSPLQCGAISGDGSKYNQSDGKIVSGVVVHPPEHDGDGQAKAPVGRFPCGQSSGDDGCRPECG